MPSTLRPGGRSWSRLLAPWLALLCLIGAALPGWAGRSMSNFNGQFNGIHPASAVNRTTEARYPGLEIEIEDRYLFLRFPEGPLKLRISEIFDRAYQLEITARDPEKGELWLVHIDK